jgi:hypothetical protein
VYGIGLRGGCDIAAFNHPYPLRSPFVAVALCFPRSTTCLAAHILSALTHCPPAPLRAVSQAPPTT